MSSEITRFNHVTDWGMERDARGDYVLYSDHEAEVARLRAEVEGLREVLKKAWEDVNWMTNDGALLSRECFGYLDAAIGASA